MSYSKGKVFKDIADLADKYKDALTELSTHGASGFEEWFIGGNAYKITSHSRNHMIPFTVEHLHGSNLMDLTLDYARSIDAALISIMAEQEKSSSNLLIGNYALQFINKLLYRSYHSQIIIYV